MRNALSIDVEEHFQAHAFETAIARADWDRQESRVVANTRRLLAVLAETGTRATFFVLGWVADRHPGLVREIAAAGHEIGSHGYAHELVYRQTPEEFAADLARSLDAIARALPPAAERRFGYRAPAFSVTDDSRWALDVLRAHGIRYDSSIVPAVTNGSRANAVLRGGKRRGVADASRFAARIAGLWEFPVSTVRIAGRNWPVAGGGYFRLLPLWATRAALRRINAEGRPGVVYLHPWEVDPAQPAVPNVPRLARWRHGINLGRTEARLRRLLAMERFGPLCEVFAAELAS
ncbi:MAG TPA: XrtA system polysaccharide deacetylase [Candidatus Binatia bacterium]|nr:XrtA system polysaccharide deacetylase [Candidatus Binatia bacterium]